MRIGITFSPEQSVWYSGANQTALLLAELFSTLQYDVTLVDRTHSDMKWFDDYPMPTEWTASTLYHTKNLDWLIDVDGMVREEDRKKAASQSIVFLRTFLQFSEMDSSVYSDIPYHPRSFKGVHEIWCWDILNPSDTLPSIQTLFPCPIRRVPFIWSPTILTHFTKECATYDKEKPWAIHVAEKNSNNTSSSVIPLVAIRHMVKTSISIIPSPSYHIHNIDAVKENRFLKENVFVTIEFDTLPIIICPKVPWYTWTSNSLLLSHSRFVVLRTSLLSLLWMGIPVVHNSPILSNLHPLLQSMYYKGNDIQGIHTVTTSFLTTPEKWYTGLTSIRESIMKQYSITSNLLTWSAICDNMVHRSIPMSRTPDIIIAFSDMWPGFNYDSNFIVDALRHEAPTLSFKGVRYSTTVIPSLVLFGPYSTEWKQIPSSIPKVFFSGENWDILQDSSISLYLTSSMKEDDTHVRIPTWMSFIDWFTESKELPHDCMDNPIRIPLHFAMNPHPIPFSERSEFCAFVVSNPTCDIRNKTFQQVNAYKKVNSGGALYNNVGGQLALQYAGGGCGDISKHAFFLRHRFTISFENSQSPGYLTEKLLHAKMAGCVPLYWGDTDAIDFVPHSFINLSAITSADKVVDIIKKLEAHPDMCSTIAATPILDEERKQKALRMISVMSQKLLALIHLPLQRPILNRIDKTFIINLDSRPDRLQSLFSVEPCLEQMVTRIPAVHGKTLQMNNVIYNLFKNNPFQWKKSIIGCYLSHLSIWSQLTQEPGNLFLVLEDDVRFTHDWVKQWNTIAKDMPLDAELIYWGGVLPPNKGILPHVLETVCKGWSRIRPNTFFSKDPQPFFHFCTYSYLITKAGVHKLIEYIMSLDGMPFAGCDHLLGRAGLCTYVTDPLLASCFQDEDPVYIHAQFDKQDAVFDSDIRNDKDCFTVCDITPFYDKPYHTQHNLQLASKKVLFIYYMSDDKNKPFELYEKAWLDDMFQRDIQMIPMVDLADALVDTLVDAWFLVQRPYLAAWNAVFQTYHANQRAFKVLHLSDEFGMDDLSFYSLPSCKAVIRNYLREDVPITTNVSHILTIPLGYHHKYQGALKKMNERKWQWSFHGTDWFERSKQLQLFQHIVPHSCHLQPEWNHSNGTKQSDYLSILGNSIFCPVLRGNHSETFRFYEALEAGVLPLFGNTISPHFISWVKEHIDLSTHYNWNSKESILQSNTEKACLDMVVQWAAWKEKIKESCSTLLSM